MGERTTYCVAATILSFIASWNNFIFVLILGGKDTITLPMAVYSFVSFEDVNWGGLTGAPAFADEARKSKKHCILLWMNGGASQFETLDPKPGARTGGQPFQGNTGAVSAYRLGSTTRMFLSRTCIVIGWAPVFWPLTNRVGPYGMKCRSQVEAASASMIASRLATMVSPYCRVCTVRRSASGIPHRRHGATSRRVATA